MYTCIHIYIYASATTHMRLTFADDACYVCVLLCFVMGCL